MVERTEPIYFAATLRDKVTPRRGGLQISSAGGTCTLGFNTRVSSGLLSFRSFITASHCTNVQGGVESTQFHQPFASNPIGTEVADPVYFTGFPCPSGRRCRFSDAARALYLTGREFRPRGHSPARPPARSPMARSRSTRPTRSSTSSRNWIRFRERRSTKWVARRVGLTLEDRQHLHRSQCRHIATHLVVSEQDDRSNLSPVSCRPGDSGSPVFYWDGGSNVGLTGILWGGNSSRTQSPFSPISETKRELGALKTF